MFSFVTYKRALFATSKVVICEFYLVYVSSLTHFFSLELKFRSIQELAPQLKCLAIYGGTGYESQIVPLKGKVDIVCATPGRLRDLMERKNFVIYIYIYEI